MACQQCDNPALYYITGDNEKQKIPLCLNCYERHHAIVQQEIENNLAMANQAAAEMESLTGFPVPRIAIPPRVQPMTFNHIRIDRSNVGVVNTGHAHQIDAVVTTTEKAGDSQLSQALREFTQAVIDSNEIEKATRDAIIEHLSFLASQVATEEKQPSVARTVLSETGKIVGTISTLLTLWNQLEPLLKGALGL